MSGSVFICGVSRGIGLELARLYRQDGVPVYGIGRSPEPEHAVDGLVYRSLPAQNFSLEAFPELNGQRFGKVILNSAIFGPPAQFTLDFPVEALRMMFETNVISHFKVLKALLPLIERDGSGQVCFIISRAGIQSTIGGRTAVGYRTTKSAQLSLGLSLTHLLSEQGISTALINPGSVATKIGGAKARWSPAEGATHVKEVIAHAREHPTGTVFHFDGRPIKL